VVVVSLGFEFYAAGRVSEAHRHVVRIESSGGHHSSSYSDS
jgi:hypothetical protein